MFKFEWDDQKAASNFLKHGVSFDEAVSIFGDGRVLTFSDTDLSESEDRSRTYGVSNKARCVFRFNVTGDSGIVTADSDST